MRRPVGSKAAIPNRSALVEKKDKDGEVMSKARKGTDSVLRDERNGRITRKPPSIREISRSRSIGDFGSRSSIPLPELFMEDCQKMHRKSDSSLNDLLENRRSWLTMDSEEASQNTEATYEKTPRCLLQFDPTNPSKDVVEYNNFRDDISIFPMESLGDDSNDQAQPSRSMNLRQGRNERSTATFSNGDKKSSTHLNPRPPSPTRGSLPKRNSFKFKRPSLKGGLAFLSSRNMFGEIGHTILDDDSVLSYRDDGNDQPNDECMPKSSSKQAKDALRSDNSRVPIESVDRRRKRFDEIKRGNSCFHLMTDMNETA